MPPSCAEIAELLDGISSQLSRFMNSNNDHCDLGFSLTVCDVLRWPYRGHEAVSEDSMLKRGGGVVVPYGLGVRREDESAVGAGRRRRSQAMWCGGGKFS